MSVSNELAGVTGGGHPSSCSVRDPSCKPDPFFTLGTAWFLGVIFAALLKLFGEMEEVIVP